MRIARLATAAAAVALVVPGAPASARSPYATSDGGREFKTPSGNILCGIHRYGAAQARCDILRFDYRRPTRKSCDFDFGGAFGITPGGARGRLLCVSDAPVTKNPAVLAYGRKVSAFGLTCTSSRRGARCVNRRGHGFSVGRAAYRLF